MVTLEQFQKDYDLLAKIESKINQYISLNQTLLNDTQAKLKDGIDSLTQERKDKIRAEMQECLKTMIRIALTIKEDKKISQTLTPMTANELRSV